MVPTLAQSPDDEQNNKIQSMELDEWDYAALEAEPGAAPDEQPAVETSYLQELEDLADLRDQGIISDEEFEAK